MQHAITEHLTPAQLEPALDNAPCGFVTFNDRGDIISINSTLSRLTGFEPHELQGRKFETLLNIAGRIFFQTHFFPLIRMHGKAEEVFMELMSRKGTQIPVLANASRTAGSDGASVNTCIFIAVYNRQRYEEEIIAARRQAEEALRENRELLLAREEADRHARELDRQLTRMRQVNDDLLQFSNIINHEMQECVRKILMFSRLARTDKDQDYLAKITDTANRLKVINRSLNVFIGLGLEHTPYGEVDLQQCIEEAQSEIVKRAGDDRLLLTVHDPLPVIRGAFEELKMMFLHLLGNSVKFRRNDRVQVDIHAVTYEENQYKSMDRYEYAEVVKLTITDDGRGFDNSHREYVFAMLKKLRHDSGGSGVGLAICRKVVDNHRGDISIESEEGKGTTVTVVLPV